jgi:hypothetical protein
VAHAIPDVAKVANGGLSPETERADPVDVTDELAEAAVVPTPGTKPADGTRLRGREWMILSSGVIWQRPAHSILDAPAGMSSSKNKVSHGSPYSRR